MTPAEKLTEAEAEYHALVTGNKPRVIVDQNGERVEFTMANVARLAAYIQSLRRTLYGSTRGPASVFF